MTPARRRVRVSKYITLVNTVGAKAIDKLVEVGLVVKKEGRLIAQ